MSWWLVNYARSGPACYVSHLDTTRALQRTFARAGVVLALSRGMRPKPRISVVVPLPVGAAAPEELIVVEVDDERTRCSPREALPTLRAACAGGLDITAITMVDSRPRPVATAAAYRCRLDLPVRAAQAAVAAIMGADEAPFVRRSPKGAKQIDLREYVTAMHADGHDGAVWLDFELALTPEGTARPSEVAAEVARRCGSETQMRDVERTRVRFRDLPRDAATAAAARG